VTDQGRLVEIGTAASRAGIFVGQRISRIFEAVRVREVEGAGEGGQGIVH